MFRFADISSDGKYRYSLRRIWGDGPSCIFIMLNPSTADGNVDDPTIRRCIGFARREGCGSLAVVNCYAFRATDPRELLSLPEAERMGPKNKDVVAQFLDSSDGPVIAAWGAWGHNTGRWIKDRWGSKLSCLGKTKDGKPKHPLYLSTEAPLIPLL